jgi:hypothetical protein
MADTSAKVALLLQAKDETGPAFEAIKAKLESVKSIMERAMIWKAGEMVFETAIDGAKDFANSLIGSNMAAETLKTSLTSLYGSASEAGQAVEYFSKFSLAAPFSKADIQAAGLEIASFHQNLTDLLPSIGNVAAAMGVDLPTATDALEKAINTGSLRGLTNTLHITKAELLDFGAQTTKTGALVQSSILPAFEKLAAAKFSTGMSSQLGTMAGATQNIENQLDNLAEIAGRPMFAVLEGELKNLVSFLSAHQADVNNFATNLGNFMGWAANAVAVSFSYIGNAVGNFVNWFGSNVVPAIETFVGQMARTFESGGWAGIIGALFEDWWVTEKRWLGTIFDTIGNWMDDVVASLHQHGPAMKKALLQWIIDADNASYSALGALMGTIGNWMDTTLIPWMHTRNAGKIASAFSSWVGDASKAVLDDLGKAIADWMNWINTTGEQKLRQMGVNLAQGLIDGIKSMAGGVKDAFTGMVSHGWDAAKSFVGMSSPSKLFFTMGVSIGQGLIDGMKSLLGDITAMGNAISAAATGGGEKMKIGALSDQQLGATIIAGWFGGGFGGTGGVGAGPSLGSFNLPALELPALPAVAAALKSPALAGLTGVGSGAGVGGASGRVPLGVLGAQFMQVDATGGALHTGTSPQERLQQRQVDQGQKQIDQGTSQVTLLQEMRDFMATTNQGINRIADMVTRGATPQTPPINTAQALGVARPVF